MRPDFLPEDCKLIGTFSDCELWQGQRGIYGVIIDEDGQPKTAPILQQNSAMLEAGIISIADFTRLSRGLYR